MTADRASVEAMAAELHRARLERTTVPTFTARPGGLDTATAYAVQEAGIALRESDGERVVGGKLGFTSEAMRRAMGVDSPNYGWLTDAMLVDGDEVDLDGLIHPKVEPEIAFVLGRDLVGPGLTAADVLAATRAVAPCLEVVDSRYEGFRFRAEDNIADDSSAGRVVLGEPVDLADLAGADLRLVGCVVTVDGAMAHTAAGAAAHDDPAAAVAWMANACGRRLPAGAVVISGGLTPPVDLLEGTTVVVELDRLGTTRAHAVRPSTVPSEHREQPCRS
ncbi:fumarylacetoacetate hydrolase family protein [Phycicoccus sp.]|uniref:2-keto-4-pentenoate hydratase n=1 Tax=Phycicoccus sp. TaxID=1902410 RepID=UPI002C60EBD9|nr:fumarylacetoacetate hydrolase family protein [Phycicoccus sp.]HMM95993.1 fumarylacetoacetate hydrolase family protein [Phycicoccus sp.]